VSDTLNARWRKPVKPMAVADEPGWASAETGRATQDYKVRFHPDDVERIRLGYVCIRCWEPHEKPFPDTCGLCGFPMKLDQPKEFENKFKGEERNPRAVLIEKELDALDDKADREFYVVKNGIIVPRTV